MAFLKTEARVQNAEFTGAKGVTLVPPDSLVKMRDGMEEPGTRAKKRM
ncbi:MAG: hypothetical protein ACLFWL_10140 [Candidatus Brocadiia bacterium]